MTTKGSIFNENQLLTRITEYAPWQIVQDPDKLLTVIKMRDL